MITFAPGVLLPGPVRLPVLARAAGWYAVSKPAGVAVAPDVLHPDTPGLAGAIGAGLNAGKRQLHDMGITAAMAVHRLDIEATGCVVLADSAESATLLRNALGSSRFEFIYDVLVENGPKTPAGDSADCRLPLAPHPLVPRMLVSHREGRKCATRFTRTESFGRYSLWEARTSDNRPHQVRIHAAESRLRIPGEHLYVRVRLPYLSSIKRNYRPGSGDEQPLHGPLCLHLREVRFPSPDGGVVAVAAPRPRSFSALLSCLARYT